MKTVTVIPLQKSIFKEELTYFTSKEIVPGSVVEIQVRNKKILGIALSSEDVSSSKSNIKGMSFELKKILNVKEKSFFRNEFIESGIKLSRYFATQKGNTLMHLMPTSFRENYDTLVTFLNKENNSKEKNKNQKLEKILLQKSIEDRISFYKKLIRDSFKKGESVFMVLPGEKEVERFKDFFKEEFEDYIFSIHSKITEKKQLDIFKKINLNENPVFIIGTPQFLSIPRKDIKTIIIENESSNSYKNFNRPFLDMRVFVEIYAENIKAKLILADTLLRFETIARKIELKIKDLSFDIYANQEIEIENPNENKDEPDLEKGNKKKFKLFKDETIEEIQKTIKNKENIFVFSLRKGLATMTVCSDCANTIECKNCSSPLVLYLSKDGENRVFVCNKCKSENDPMMKCPICDSWNLTPLGIGTDKFEEELRKIFPKEKIFKLDKESAKTNKGAEKIVKEFESTKGAILVGTEMAFSYINNKTKLSIIGSFDSLFSVPNFKISEKILHIIISTIGITNGKIIIQTKNGNSEILKIIKTKNILPFIEKELELRKKLNYSPFKRFIKISYFGDKENTIIAKKYLAETLKDYNPDMFSAFLSKQKGKYVTNALLKIDPEKWSSPEILPNSKIDEKLLIKLLNLPPDFYINIDPEDLL